MATINELQTWINSGKFASWNRDVFIKSIADTFNHKEILFSIFTETNEYTISAVEPSVTLDIGGYLGCTVSSRKCRPGETWTRGNDLADGPFTYETWVRIMSDIISCEMQKVTNKPLEQTFDLK